MDTFFIIFYCSWILITIVFKLGIAKINRYKWLDVFNLIPAWSFFSPKPVRHDYHILYRDKVNGSAGDFVLLKTDTSFSIPIIAEPEGRIKLVLFKLASTLDRFIKKGQPADKIISSHQYLYILYIVMKKDLAEGAQRQFAIVRTDGRDTTSKPVVILTSDFHGY